ncbi:MAG: Asp23/Gls24 family envelope stress response protein [Eubacteriales bacterium]
MIYKKDTGIGQIAVEKNVIMQIIYKVVETFDKKVIVGNYTKNTNKLYYKMGAGAESNAIEITNGENGIDIKIHIMVKFGTSISQVTKLLIDGVNEGVMSTFGIAPAGVEIIVTGVISKNVGMRNIKVTGKR